MTVTHMQTHPREYSLAYLTSSQLTPPQAILMAAELGYRAVGLRLWPNAAGAPQQYLMGDAAILRETQAVQKETGVGVFDLEIIRIGEVFDPQTYRPLFEAGQALNAKAFLVAGDDTNHTRLAENYARLCEAVRPYGMTADLEFMPWTAVPNAKAAMQIVEAAGRPSNAGILVDALHFGRSDTSLEDIRAIPRELLHYAQICDATTSQQIGRAFTVEEMIYTARSERLLPGEGGIDLVGLFNALPKDIPISVEIVDFKRLEKLGAREWALQCLQSSQKLIKSTS